MGRRRLITVRHYGLAVPTTYEPAKPTPLLVYFHGQSDAWPPAEEGYHSLGEKHRFITVYPRGYGDFNGKDRAGYIAWNVGLMDEGLAKANDTCFENTVPTCYDSCKGQCSRCAWSTCVDDVLFVKQMIGALAKDYNIDHQSIFATGCSNGGMFTHYLASREPHLFRAVMPIYGLPLAGRLHVPPALRNVPILQMHDRSDTTIPWQGGMSADGWVYEAMSTAMSTWARVHGCLSSTHLRGVATPFDGGNKNFVCQEYKRCTGRVISCFYDGTHGSWPASGQIEGIAWWFFSQFIGSEAVANASMLVASL